jgi:cytosine/adenosine deaminase-related metal-dependent hydrolase
LLHIGAAILGPHYSTLEVAMHDFGMARDLGIVASLHQGGGAPRTPGGWLRLEEAGLLGPRVNVVHGQGLDDEQLSRFCALGMSFTVTPEVELSEGHGFPITGRLIRNGRAPSLGVDIEAAISGDMLTVARFALAAQRSLTPGKQADVVLLRADVLNMRPVHDPASAVVMQAGLGNIDSVMVAGEWKKRYGRLLVDGLEAKLDRLRESGERIVHDMGLKLV